jgi:hypothetical protein
MSPAERSSTGCAQAAEAIINQRAFIDGEYVDALKRVQRLKAEMARRVRRPNKGWDVV